MEIEDIRVFRHQPAKPGGLLPAYAAPAGHYARVEDIVEYLRTEAQARNVDLLEFLATQLDWLRT